MKTDEIEVNFIKLFKEYHPFGILLIDCFILKNVALLKNYICKNLPLNHVIYNIIKLFLFSL